MVSHKRFDRLSHHRKQPAYSLRIALPDGSKETVVQVVDLGPSNAQIRKGVAIDLQRVDFLSSSGVAILVGLKRRVEQNHGKLVLFAVQPVVEDLLRIMRLTQYFTFAPDEATALTSLHPLSTA